MYITSRLNIYYFVICLVDILNNRLCTIQGSHKIFIVYHNIQEFPP